MPARPGCCRACRKTLSKNKRSVIAVLCSILVILAILLPFKHFRDLLHKKLFDADHARGSSKFQLIYRLPLTLQPLHYDLELIPNIYQPNSSDFDFRGTVKIEFLCRNRTSDVIVHAVDLAIAESDVQISALDGEDSSAIVIQSWQVSSERESLELHLQRPLSERHRYLLRVAFRGKITDHFRAIYFASYQENNQTRYFASTIFVPNNARLAFPCFDEPGFKARFSLTIVRKEAFISISNMPRNATHQRIVDGEVWFADHFLTTPLMSTYLLTFTVCQFAHLEVNSSSGYKVRAWTRPGRVLETQHALEMAERVMAYYNDYFALAYPLPEQEMIALPGFQYAGMEHWGLVSYSEASILYLPAWATIDDKESVTRLIAHEMAHMWFGDLLTMAWWDDTWLNEGFATFVEYLGTDYASPQWKIMDQFLVKTFRQAMLQDSTETSTALHRNIVSKEDVLGAYNSIIYVKGASIIRMVKFFLGDSTFKAGIKKYLQRFQYSTATQQDLWETLTRETAKDGVHLNLSDIMDSWTVQNNYPVVTVTRGQSGKMTVSQRRYLLERQEASGFRSHAWDIPFTFMTDASSQPDVHPSPRDIIWLSRHVLDGDILMEGIPSAAEKERWILGNVGCYGFFRMNYDLVNWKALISQLNRDHQKIPAANRVQIISDSWNLAKACLLNYSVALGTLEYLHNETSYLPWEATVFELQELVKMLSPGDQALGKLKKFMHGKTIRGFSVYNPDSKPVDDLDKRTPWLIAKTACSFDLPSCLSMAREEFRKWMAGSHHIIAEMRQVFHCTALAHGTEAEWNYVFLRVNQEKITSERKRFLSALACSRNTTTLRTLGEWALNPDKFQEQDAIDVLHLLSESLYGSDIVWRLIKENFSNIMNRFGHTAFIMKGLLSKATETFRTQSQLQELQEFLAKHPDVAPDVLEAVERTHANIRWVQTNLATIEYWLDDRYADS